MSYDFTPFQVLQLNDFRGGLNITDPPSGLPANVMTELQDLVLSRQGVLEQREAYRPEYFQSAVKKAHLIVGADEPTKVYDVQVVKCSEAGYSYDGKLWVVTCQFSGSIKVLVRKTSDDTWHVAGTFANATEVSVVPFRVNEALDILMFPNNATPQRYAVGGATQAMGLTVPAAGAFSAAFTELTTGNLTLITGQKFFYKYSYFYDNDNVSTRFGESEAVAITTGSEFEASGDEPASSIQMDFTALVEIDSDVKYIYIYRSLTEEGPYRYLDRVLVTEATPDEIEQYVDNTPIDFEGTETMLDDSDPTAEGLKILQVKAIGSQLYGFDATLQHKFVRSMPGHPDIWLPLEYDYLDGEGRGFVEFNRKLFVFSEYSCFEKASANADAVKISKVGCVDHRTIQNVGRGICWMDYDSVYFADFITAYGSKRDFPKDIGHPVSGAIVDWNSAQVTDSMFSNQRYHLIFTRNNEARPKHFIYDVDFDAWTSFGCGHSVWARKDESYWSVGKSKGAESQNWYVYYHGYRQDINDAGNTYKGRDYHDYNAVNATPALDERYDIPCLIGRAGIRLGLNVQKAILLSGYLKLACLGADPVLTIEGGDTVFSKELVFNDIGSIDEISTEFPALWGYAVWADDPQANATEAIPGWVGTDTIDNDQHKKIIPPIKSSEFKLQLTFGAARKVQMVTLDINYRLLPAPA